MQSYYTTIPSYITTRNDLTGEEKIFYGTVQSLCCKYGFCWASNRTLAKIAQRNIRQIQRYLEKLRRHGLLHVEIEYNNERKIWTDVTWQNRDNLKKSLAQDVEFNQRFYTHDMDDMGGMTCMSPNRYNVNIHKELGGMEESMRETKHPLPPISQKNNTQEKIAQPVRQKQAIGREPVIQKQPVPGVKEKVPIPEPSLEEANSLIARMGKKHYDKYLRNAQNHLKTSKPGSKYHRMSVHDVIWSFYMEDHEKAVARAEARKEDLSVAAKADREWFEEVCRLNPTMVGQFEAGRHEAQIMYTPASGAKCLKYGNDGFRATVEQVLTRRKRVLGMDYVLPDKEGE